MTRPPTIWKYTLPIADEHSIEIPTGHRTLSVDMDPSGAGIAVWVLVHPDAPQRPRRFHVRGTGHPLGPETTAGGFRGTVVDRATGLVWHVFEEVTA